MKIEKDKLTKALKQIGIFIGKNSIDKNSSLIHFRNENNRTMLFATDFASAGRTYFDTDEPGLFEFCIEYDNLLQTTRARGKELNAEIYSGRENENGEKVSGIEFTDGKSKFNWALRGNDSLQIHEEATAVPSDAEFFEIDAKSLKSAIKKGGFARNEKDTQYPYTNGVNFLGKGSEMSLMSTDKHRIAGWKSISPEEFEGMESEEVSGILSPKTISSIGLYDDGEKIRVYITPSQIILVSSSLEAYASKILCDFPNVQQQFDREVVSTYEISARDLKESIEIVLNKEDSISMEFREDSITVSSMRLDGDGNTDDTFPCTRTLGGDESILIKPNDLLDIVKNTTEDRMTLSFREMGNGYKTISYSLSDGSYGIIAPMRR